MKAYLAAALEDLVGEYVLNISKENLKMAALRGKVKLENVELDGDFIGSHILGAVGLSGFGVLSCWARTLKINVPWTNLDASVLEIRGMHLVCVPLLPTTANRKYHGPQSLRTRAKRSALARFERNFFSGRIAGEGPQQEISSNDGQTISYNGRRRRWSTSEDLDGEEDFGGSSNSSNNPGEVSASSSIQHAQDATSTTKKEKEAGLPGLKKRVKAKIYENLLTSVNDVHIRCEIPEGGLNMNLPQKMDGTKHRNGDKSPNQGNSDQRAFAFGLTLKRLSIRNVSEDELSDNDLSGAYDQCQSTSVPTRSDSGNSSVSDGESKSQKKVEIEDLSIYWDDDPPILVTESDLLNGRFPVSDVTCQQRIAEAMKQMSTRRDPGFDVIASLSEKSPPTKHASLIGHDYICKAFSLTILTTMTGEASEGSLCFAEILPCRLDLSITSRQYKQYQLLMNAVLSQQRFDTMLHRRPQKSPLEDPRSWWKYIIACVKHKPTSRSWKDVQRIVQCRKVCLELMVKNLSGDHERGGYHGGLTDDESRALVELEDFLPIETLLSFHLVALRRVFASRSTQTKQSRRASMIGNSFTRKRSSSKLGRLLNSITGSTTTSWKSLEDEYPNEDEVPTFPFPSDLDNGDSLSMPKLKMNTSTIRAKFPAQQTTSQLHSCNIIIRLLENTKKNELVTVEIDLKGTSYTSGSSKADLTCDITRFEVFDFVTKGGKVMAIEQDNQEFDYKTTVIQNNDSVDDSFKNTMCDSGVRLPPNGVICRATAILDVRGLSLNLSAHPATLIWSKPCADAVAEFFSSSTQQIQNQFLSQLRNAATPIAHRAQMATFFPTSLTVEIDVHAPKLWIPISGQLLDGALLFDAGKLKIHLKKAERSSETNWTMDVADIQIMLAGASDGTGAVLGGNEHDANDLDGVSRLRKELTTIVHPFSIHTVGSYEGQPLEMEPWQEDRPPVNNLDSQTEGKVSVNVGRICLNLVDVEELARAIGRFYASGVVMMKKTALESPFKNDGNRAAILSPAPHHPEVSAFELVHICFDKLEMALECYSSQRTYFVEAYSIKLEKKGKANMSYSRLSVSDFTIVQLADASCNQSTDSNVRYLQPSTEPHHQLLARRRVESEQMSGVSSDENLSPVNQLLTAPQTPIRKGRSSQTPFRTPKQLRQTSSQLVASPAPASPGTQFIKGCHFHDLENHVDEVEFDVQSAVLKVTPSVLSDCSTWLTRIIELIAIASKEMERRVHERGRKSRTKEKKDEGRSKGISTPVLDEGMALSAEDSSIIFRVTFKEVTILIGRPASEFADSKGRRPTDYVVQILANASILTQSIENENDTGSRTLFFSANPVFMKVAPSFHERCLLRMEDISASFTPDSDANYSDELLLSPTAIDCRVVYHTVGEGRVSFQDFSFDCETMKWSMAPHDIRVVSSVSRKVLERLDLLRSSSGNDKSGPSLSSLVHSKKKGARIATRIRAELHSSSLLLMRSFKSKTGVTPFIKFNARQLKVGLEGCIDAMAGEVDIHIQVQFYNPKSGWEDIVESNRVITAINQIPNELSVSISSPGMINTNLTAGFIKEFSDLERSSRHSESETKGSESKFNFVNETGLEVVIGLDTPSNRNLQLDFEQDSGNEHLNVPVGGTVSLDSFGLHEACTLFLGAEERQIIHNLPLVLTSTAKKCCFLYKWHPCNASNGFGSEWIEPVVEFVMQNQRLRPDVSDVNSLERGQDDLLSSSAWSASSAFTSDRGSCGKSNSDQIWLPPYLKDDAHEWSDMTNSLNLNKDDFFLPDKNWMWVDDWEVEVNEDLNANDLDGWEYATDFEAFCHPPRSYQRGDLCRRRRWTRTRQKSAAVRVLPIVWEVGSEGNTCTIKARSHLQLHNHTNVNLSFFGFCHFSNKDEYIGQVDPEQSIVVPLQLASSTHIRLAVPHTPKTSHSIDGFLTTERLMILPLGGFTSSRILRASILRDHNVNGFFSIKKQHFLLTLKCVEGAVDLHVEPALKVINLLPCQLQCQLGEIEPLVLRKATRKIRQTEVLSLSTGEEGQCLSIDCQLHPHTAVRLPGYKWSHWKRIVNRGAKSQTWRPTDEEEVALFEAFKDSASSIVHFDHKTSGGDSIDIIMSIEMGHSPSITFFAQYWILDKTGLGLGFSGGFSDLLATTPEMETKRKSYLLPTETNDRFLKLDMEREGHEWSLGMNGMSLFFSRDQQIALSVEGDTVKKSHWTSLLDVSNVMPETVKASISIDQYDGSGRYALAYNVTLCPSIFSRTRLITIFPKYVLNNLLEENLYIVQDGVQHLSAEVSVPPQSSVHFHWESSSLAPKIRLCSESGSWSRGCINLEKAGVTAMRIPSPTAKPMVVQVEVRLATKKEDSAVVVTVWASIEKSNPLYLLKNSINSQQTIFCRQKLSEQDSSCEDAFIWTLNSGESIGFGFDDPEVPHVLQWNCSNTSMFISDVEVDAMGSTSSIVLCDGSELTCEIIAEQSTKVILFTSDSEILNGHDDDKDDDANEIIATALRIDLSGISMSVIDNVSDNDPGREILYLTTEGWHINLSQSREGFHEMELRLKTLQVDNFIVDDAEHPVLIYCHNDEDVPFLHFSALRAIQEHSETLVFSYCALRILDIDISLDGRTAERIAYFLHPLRRAREEEKSDNNWITSLILKMNTRSSRRNKQLRDIEKNVHTANSGRLYLEKLHLHPVRLSLTFTQEELELSPVTEGLVIFQIIRGMPASIADAPLIFTSFVVNNTFESPQTLLGIISAHYSSQLSSQILTILGSLVILKTPADILSNIGSGVRDFFYEPLSGIVQGPTEFLEGLESGTSSLARGVFTGLVRGTASVTELVSHNLANLTSDEVFIYERNAYQKKLMNTMKAGRATTTIQDSLFVAGTCVAKGFQSGANGIFEQPSIYASRHGTAGLVKGVGKGLWGALLKPAVGVGDAAVVVMNHVSETTNDKPSFAQAHKRMRRALPRASSKSINDVKIVPYDERSANAQQIVVTSGEIEDDAYLGHVQIPSHLIIASDKFLWVIGDERKPRRISWAEISNFGVYGNCMMKIDIFSGQGPCSLKFNMSSTELSDLFGLMSMKMGNSSQSNLPGIKSIQVGHVFGSVNRHLHIEGIDLDDETKFVKACNTRVNRMSSSMPNFFRLLDQEAWLLISTVGQMFTGLSSRRCIAVGLINGSGETIQVKTAKLVQGGSPCYTIATEEYAKKRGILYPGGAIIFFGWGAVPSLLQSGNVCISIETNVFVTELTDSISHATSTQVLPNWRVSFLEKSYDQNGWWAKYWILV